MRTTKLALGCAAAALLAAANTQAIQITINNGSGAQPGSSGAATIASWLQTDVTAYNVANNPDLPTPVGAEQFRVNQGDATAPTGYPTFGANVLSITLPTAGYDYIALHWGGSGGGVYQSFYVGSIGGATPATITFQAPGRNGLSWYDTFHPTTNTNVPDGGASAALLGLGLTGVAFARRFVKS